MNSSDIAVSMRAFPYPFRAALALCSDIDCCSRKAFTAIHRFLNTKQGLGLPVADSFFAVSCEGKQMAYFLPDGSTRSEDADFIQRCIKAGLVDSLHTWGDFNTAPPQPDFLIGVAKRLTNEFMHRGLEVKVWINHGSPNNRQNLKSRLNSDYAGDDPESPYYTSDLLRDLGIKFYWWSEVVPWPLSTRFKSTSPHFWFRKGFNALKNEVKVCSGRRNQVRIFSSLTDLGQPVHLRDGSRLIGFTRFNSHPHGEWTLPTRHTLRYSLSPKVLNELVRQEGFLILYTHLGLPNWRDDEDEIMFPNPDKEALARLASLFHEGKIWVAPTSQLLTYWFVRQYLEWQVSRVGEKTVIDLGSLNDPIAGRRPPRSDELSGLCFYTPNPEKTEIRLELKELPRTAYSPDHTGMGTVGLPLPATPRTDPLKS